MGPEKHPGHGSSHPICGPDDSDARFGCHGRFWERSPCHGGEFGGRPVSSCSRRDGVARERDWAIRSGVSATDFHVRTTVMRTCTATMGSALSARSLSLLGFSKSNPPCARLSYGFAWDQGLPRFPDRFSFLARFENGFSLFRSLFKTFLKI